MMKEIIMNSRILAIALIFGLVSSSCKKENPTLGSPPSASDAEFTFAPTDTNDNIIVFSANNPNQDIIWDFGNGSGAKGPKASAIYPFAGTYTVTITVQNKGGFATSTTDVVIAQDDFSLIANPIYTLLTGGSERTWYIDSTVQGHFGVGPSPSNGDFTGYFPKWWDAPPLDKKGAGMYDDRYVFKIQGFVFDMISNGDVYVNSEHAGIPPFDDTTAAPVGDFIANFPNQLGENWVVTESASDTTLTLSGDAMIGYWAGTRTYRIIRISNEELFLGCQDAANADLYWYVLLKPE